MTAMRALGKASRIWLGAAVLGSLGALTTSPARAESAAVAEDEPAYRALRTDLERLVESQQGGGWRIDRYEYEDMMPSALMTVCKVPASTRQRVLAYYDWRIAGFGGPVEIAWERTKDLDAIKPLLFVSRVRGLLVEAMKRAQTECPPWMTPDPKFRGLQSDAEQWSLNVETGGLLQIRRSEGRWTYGGGGVIRLLVARGFANTSVLFGPEFAGGAMLRFGQEGGFVLNYFPAVPFVVRFHQRTWHYDVEIAPVALFQADDTRFSYGVRFGVGGGIQSRRTRGVIPWAGLHVAYETYFPGARAAAQFLRGGLRVGIIWE